MYLHFSHMPSFITNVFFPSELLVYLSGSTVFNLEMNYTNCSDHIRYTRKCAFTFLFGSYLGVTHLFHINLQRSHNHFFPISHVLCLIASVTRA